MNFKLVATLVSVVAFSGPALAVVPSAVSQPTSEVIIPPSATPAAYHAKPNEWAIPPHKVVRTPDEWAIPPHKVVQTPDEWAIPPHKMGPVPDEWAIPPHH